jgi:hypothetical protein
MKIIEIEHHWEVPLFPLSVAAVGARFNVATIRSWFQRGNLGLLERDARAAENGLPHLLSFRSIVAIAITCDLTRLGLSPKLAFEHASKFTDSANNCVLTGMQRKPCDLFGAGYATILTIPHDGFNSQIVAVKEGDDWSIPLNLLFGSQVTIARLLDIDTLYYRTRNAGDGYLRDDGEEGELVE